MVYVREMARGWECRMVVLEEPASCGRAERKVVWRMEMGSCWKDFKPLDTAGNFLKLMMRREETPPGRESVALPFKVCCSSLLNPVA